jgi:enoyl-CoA hydratase
MSYQNIIVETKGRVGIIKLNRPQQLNALNAALKAEVDQAVRALDADNNIGCIILTGSEKAFAAGADIKEMLDLAEPVENWEGIARARKPMIAAVAGVALGGGCEIAMQCDIIIAADNARFGQPEIKIGVIPGFGGTQRLTHAVGKSKSMEMTLTGRMMDAQEAERSGLVARVVPVAQLMDEAMKAAEIIASMSLPSVIAAKAAVNAAFENPLAAGVKLERENFRRLFKTHDRVEGMKAFVEKRSPKWKYE